MQGVHSNPKYGVWKETVLVNVSFSIWHLKCHWMLIPTAPIWGQKVNARYTFASLVKRLPP